MLTVGFTCTRSLEVMALGHASPWLCLCHIHTHITGGGDEKDEEEECREEAQLRHCEARLVGYEVRMWYLSSYL